MGGDDEKTLIEALRRYRYSPAVQSLMMPEAFRSVLGRAKLP